MKDKINAIRNKKHGNATDNIMDNIVRILSAVFLIAAIGGLLMVLVFFRSNLTVSSLHNMYLFITSIGCLAMSVAYVNVRSKLRKLDKYQEDMINCFYDSMEMSHDHMHKQDKQMKSIEEKLDTAAEQHIKLRSEGKSNLYLQFRHYMCPTTEELAEILRALESDIDEVGLRSELYQKLQDHYITTPLSFFKSENWLLQVNILTDDEYYEIYKAIHAKYPVLKELDRVPNLLLNISDSMEDYQL